LLDIRIERGVVKVDTNKLRKRSGFSADQVTYAQKA